MINKLFIVIIILLSLGVQAETPSELLLEEGDIQLLSLSGKYKAYGEISGIGGRLAINKIDSFVTVKNEIIPAAGLKIIVAEGKEHTADNVLALLREERTIKRQELLGVILK